MIMWSLPSDLSATQLETILIVLGRWMARLPIFSLINALLFFLSSTPGYGWMCTVLTRPIRPRMRPLTDGIIA